MCVVCVWCVLYVCDVCCMCVCVCVCVMHVCNIVFYSIGDGREDRAHTEHAQFHDRCGQ